MPRSWRPSHNRSGLPLFQGAQLTVDTTLVSPLTAGPSPAQWHLHRGSPPPSTTGQRTDLPRVNSRWPVQIGCPGIRAFIRLLARARARSAPVHARAATVSGLVHRWSALLSHVAHHAFASSLLTDNLTATTNVDGEAPHQRHHHTQPSSPHTLPAGIHHLLGFGFMPAHRFAHLETGQYKNSPRTDLMQQTGAREKKNIITCNPARSSKTSRGTTGGDAPAYRV